MSRVLVVSLLAVGLYSHSSTPARGGDDPVQKPQQKIITLGKETTAITEPLDAEGFVDYVAATNERLSKGVTPENNFEVVVRNVLGPIEIGEEMRGEYYRMLGIPVPDGGENQYFRDYVDFVGREGLSQKETDELFEEDRRLGERPWTAKEFPRAAKWLASNAKHLDAIVEGSKRPRNYTPYLAGDWEEGSPGPRMIAILLPSAQQQRSVARVLNKRALLRIGEGKLDEAWSDLQAMHRVAHHAASGFTLIEALVGIAIDALAFQGETQLLASPNLTAAAARRYLDDVKKLPAVPSMAEKIDVGERWMGLDCVTSIGRENAKDLFKMLNLINALSDTGTRPRVPVGVTFVGFDDEKPANERPIEYTIDWNVTLRLMNGWYDRLVVAGKEPDFAKRRELFEAIEQDIKKLKVDTTDPQKLLGRLVTGNAREELGRSIGNILVALLIPAVQQARLAEDQALARREVLEIGLALKTFQLETGNVPKSLAALAPKYIESVPNDPLSGKSLQYETSEGGFVVYSVGRNGEDDGGRGYDDRTEAREDRDDIAVRVERR